VVSPDSESAEPTALTHRRQRCDPSRWIGGPGATPLISKTADTRKDPRWRRRSLGTSVVPTPGCFPRFGVSSSECMTSRRKFYGYRPSTTTSLHSSTPTIWATSSHRSLCRPSLRSLDLHNPHRFIHRRAGKPARQTCPGLDEFAGTCQAVRLSERGVCPGQPPAVRPDKLTTRIGRSMGARRCRGGRRAAGRLATASPPDD
jgi:hypothetical protein